MPELSRRVVLIIGGAGYVGSVLTRHLLGEGYRVRVLDALLYENEKAIADLHGNDRFSFVRGDFCDSSILKSALAGATDIIMLAALVGDPICRKYPELARKINETGTLRLIERLGEYPINRFVFMSTCSNYGLRETDEPADETCELNPQSLYAELKVNVERFLLANANRFGFVSTVLRGATAYGLSHRMRFDLTINEFTRELAAGNELLVYDADTWRPYCHLVDFARAIQVVLEAPGESVRGEVFNLGGTGGNYTKRMLVDLLSRQIPSARIVFREGSTDPRNYRVTFDKIRDRLVFSIARDVERYVPELMGRLSQGDFADYATHKNFYGNYQIR
jgi:nucleoside-diphosphate-sugar epimerase